MNASNPNTREVEAEETGVQGHPWIQSKFNNNMDLAQPYLIGTAKVIKPAQLLDKDPATLHRMMPSPSWRLSLLVLISLYYMLGELLIFVLLGEIGLWGISY